MFIYVSGPDWIALLPFFLTVFVLLYAVVKLFLPGPRHKPPRVNASIKLDSPKVVDPVDIEDFDKDKVSYCRCWRSSKVNRPQLAKSPCHPSATNMSACVCFHIKPAAVNMVHNKTMLSK